MDGDYATRRVEEWHGNEMSIVDDGMRSDKAMAVAREQWEWRKLVGPYIDCICVRNERTGAVCDTISRPGVEEE